LVTSNLLGFSLNSLRLQFRSISVRQCRSMLQPVRTAGLNGVGVVRHSFLTYPAERRVGRRGARGRGRRTPDGGGLVIDPRVEQLRRIVVAEVGEETTRRAQQGLPPLDPVDRRQMARSILRRELDGQWRAAQQRGEMTLTPEEE